MSFAEIKRQTPQLSRKQRGELSELLSAAASADLPEWTKELARRNARIDAGEKFAIDDFRLRHEELSAGGR